MTRRSKRRANGKSRKRIDVTALRELLGDTAAHAVIGKVVADDSGNAYDIDLVDGEVREITAEIMIVPKGGRVTARLASAGASPLSGVFRLPEVGDEFLVLLIDGDPTNAVAAVPLSGVRFPSSIQLATGGKLLVVGSQVLVTDATGGGEEPLVKKSEFDGHLHGTGVGNSTDPIAPITGTTVLRAK